MKLSELVKLRNDLTQLSFVASRMALEEVDRHLSSIHDASLRHDYKDQLSKILKVVDYVENELFVTENQIPEIIKQIDLELIERTNEYLDTGYSINGIPFCHSMSVECERTIKLLPMHNETRAEVIVRSRKYTDWRYPALEIGPGDGTWTEHLIAGDPLYIADVHREFLDNTLNKFNPVYKNRVRPYLIGADGISDTDLSALPQNQFGFIFAWNVFNYFPLNYTKLMLDQCMKLLRPGGVMMFSFNNCDIVRCAEYAENGLASWMPQTLLVNTCKELGFEVITVASIEETVNWIEIKKPGELKTVKAHQVLGEIVRT